MSATYKTRFHEVTTFGYGVPPLRQLRVGWVLASLVASAAVISCALLFGIRGISHHVSKGNCQGFGEKSGYEVRWVDVGFWDYGCYVVTPNGLIPRDRLTGVAPVGAS